MSELLLEVFSEEIPARMQARAADDLSRAINKALLDAGYMPEGVKAFAGPRRLTCVVAGLPVRQPDRREEKKGPRVGAPEKAVAGFLKSAGLSSLDECETRSDKKGEFYVAVIEQKGRDTADVIKAFAPEIIRSFSWPKSMRWSDGDMRWVRPLHRILCVFDGEPVAFDVAGKTAADETQGHRFMAPDVIQTRSFEDYAAKLRDAKVILDAVERKDIIAADAATLCKAQGLELVDDPALLSEVSGLAEWPVALMGTFDEKFLTLPDEVLTASMRGHQKYFSVRDPKSGSLANKFVCVANIEAPDGGAAMRQGYERVLTARLSDGWFLYNEDLKTPLADRIADLDRVTFFEGLGSIGDKARRVAALAKEIAPSVGADPAQAARAAMLAKADLVSQMVNEFPELQGVMGRYYALEQGESADIADAIRDHYKPVGQGDDVPTAPVSVAVALADKIDSLVGFWAIDKKPTGSSDPFALRRAALGVIQNIEEHSARLQLMGVVENHIERVANDIFENLFPQEGALLASLESEGISESSLKEVLSTLAEKLQIREKVVEIHQQLLATPIALLAFFHDRLKVFLREKGHRHDHIDAVLTDALGILQDDLVLIVAKMKALEAFLKTDDGANLVAAFKRAANILKAEEKKGAQKKDFAFSDTLLNQTEEKSLFAALKGAETDAQKAVADEDFEGAMTALSALRAPLDAFFENVTVNADDEKLRTNRLALLQRFIAATASVANFARLEG